METLVLVMMILVCFSFVLKQTFHGVKEIMIISVLVAFFVGMTWPLAIEQSKTQIAAWIADQKLMLDMAVLLSIDVALTMLFCVNHVDLKTSEHVSRRKWVFFIFLKYFPGLLVFPVLFSVLVMTIFLLPGVSFQVVAWVLAVVLLVLTPVFTYGLRWLLPERPIRLELLFLVEVLLGLVGIIGTVNGRTAVAGFNSFDALSLLGVIAIVIVGMAIGWAIYNYQIKNIEYNELHIRRIVWISTGMLVPVIILLIFFFLRALLLLGGFFGQYLVKRKSGAEIREQMNTLTLDNIDTLGDRLPKNKQAVIVSYMKKLVDNRQSKAQVNRILDQYAQFVEKDLSLPSTLLKMGPMLGLMGTLIPMGPALVGLSAGDIASMAYNMQVAFATTVVGLFSAGIGFVTKQTKNRWYTEDMSNLEFMADLIDEKSNSLTS